MSHQLCVLVRADRHARHVALTVTGDVTGPGQQQLALMIARARTLFPDTTVTVDLSSARTVATAGSQAPDGEHTHHPDDSQSETSSTPAPLP